MSNPVSTYRIKESAEINAPASVAYNVIADYEVGHPAILPKTFISTVTVFEGGHGAGTVIAVQTAPRLGNRTLTMEISEPEPGKILQEDIRENGTSSRFIVEPLGESRCRVTFDTHGKTDSGLRGWVEAMLSPLLLRPIYKEELKLLDQYVQQMA